MEYHDADGERHVGGRNVCYVANAEARFTYTDVPVIREAQMASVESMRTLCKQPLDQ